MLTLTPDQRTGSVELNLSTAAGVTAIVRADINGTRPVRLERGTLPATGKLTVTDWEPALSGLIQYRLIGPVLEDSAWTALPKAELPRFVIPSIPQFSVIAQAVTEYSAARQSRSVFHKVIGRAAPLVAEGELEPRTGTLTCLFDTYAEAKDLEDLLERGQTVMYRQQEHPGLDMYFHPERVSINPDPETETWTLAIDYIEVAFPAGAVLSAAAWTFDALAKKYPSFEAVTDAYSSFHNLTIGETK